MSTVNKEFADRIVAGGGWLDGDATNELGDNPQCVAITRYVNFWGCDAYGLTFKGQGNKYTPSEFIKRPTCYWRAP